MSIFNPGNSAAIRLEPQDATPRAATFDQSVLLIRMRITPTSIKKELRAAE
jgi:hypothetical protein